MVSISPNPPIIVSLSAELTVEGDAVFLHGLGQKIVVLNTHKAMVDLLEKRSTIYSNRPKLILAGEMYTVDKVNLISKGPIMFY